MEKRVNKILKASYSYNDIEFMPIYNLINVCEEAKRLSATIFCFDATPNNDGGIDSIDIEIYSEELETDEAFARRIEEERLREESVRKYIEKSEKAQLDYLLKKYPTT